MIITSNLLQETFQTNIKRNETKTEKIKKQRNSSFRCEVCSHSLTHTFAYARKYFMIMKRMYVWIATDFRCSSCLMWMWR